MDKQEKAEEKQVKESQQVEEPKQAEKPEVIEGEVVEGKGPRGQIRIPAQAVDKPPEKKPPKQESLKRKITKASKQRKIIFKNGQCPGDLMMLTAAIRDLKKAHPEILIDVRTPCDALWENSPHLSPIEENDPDVEIFRLDYPLIHNSNRGQYHFIPHR